jgi:hypothetical protein
MKPVTDTGRLLNTYVTGFVLDEQTQLAPAVAQQPDVAAWLRELPADQFPTIRAVADRLADALSTSE